MSSTPKRHMLAVNVPNGRAERAINDVVLHTGNEPYILYGSDNLLPQRLLDYANIAPTHGAILKKKIDFTLGRRISIREPGYGWLEDSIGNGLGLQALAEQMAVDYWTFSGFALQMLWDGAGNLVGDVVPTAWQQLRWGLSKEENEEGLLDWGVWFSAFWEYQSNDTKFQPEFYELYNADVPCTKPVFVYYRKRTPGMNYYPVPGYYAARRAIQNEADAYDLMGSIVSNSYLPSGVLALPGMLNDEQEKDLRKTVEETFSGKDNVGKLFVTRRDQDTGAVWEPLSLNLGDKDITPLVQPAVQAIITAHQLPSPLLAGLPAGPTLGGSGQELVVAMNQFFDSQIQPAQSLIKDYLEWAIAQMGYRVTIDIEENRPDYGSLIG